MGRLSSVFTNVKNGITGKGRTGYFKATQKWNKSHAKKGGYAGGYGAISFENIINAHSSAEEIVEVFGLDKEDNVYGCNAYIKAYTEQREIAQIICNQLNMVFSSNEKSYTIDDVIDAQEVEERAFEYACEFAEELITGQRWIPYDIINWAYYDVSNHNG